MFLVCSGTNTVVFGKAGRGCEAGPAYSFYKSLACMDLVMQWCLSSIKRHKLVHSYNGNESHEKIRQLVCVVCSKLISKAVMQVPKSKQRFFSQIARKVVKVLTDHFYGEKMPTLRQRTSCSVQCPIAFRVSSARSVIRTSAN
jgi:DNA-binding protein